MHISFSTIYFLQEQKLNPRNYSEQEIIMSIFVGNTDHDMNIQAKIHSISNYRSLQINILVLGFL
jgi:hypothetical protein